MDCDNCSGYNLIGLASTLAIFISKNIDSSNLNAFAALFSAILMSSAILSEIEIDTAGLFAEKFGIAFQIKNDMEENSAKTDTKNEIITAIGIFGIEKTQLLLDNYREEMRGLLKEVSDNSYKKALEELIINYV